MNAQKMTLGLLISLSMCTPLWAGPLEDDPTSKECATNQPELRKIFPVEMELLKYFEGHYSDIPERRNNALREGKDPDKLAASIEAKGIAFNANKNKIEFQLSKTGNDIRKERVGKVIQVKVCKTRQGMMRVLGEGLEMDIQVHSEKQAIIRDGKSWRKYYRINTSHSAFREPKDTLSEEGSGESKQDFTPTSDSPGVS
jgi:hypothetical protein